MASISSISGAQSAAQSGLQQIRLQQARRDAEQAERTASTLQAAASSAQQIVREAEDNARSIAVQAEQAQTNAAQARLGLATMRSVSQMQTRIAGVVTQVAENPKIAEPAVPARNVASAVVNVQGQVTGTVINITA